MFSGLHLSLSFLVLVSPVLFSGLMLLMVPLWWWPWQSLLLSVSSRAGKNTCLCPEAAPKASVIPLGLRAKLPILMQDGGGWGSHYFRCILPQGLGGESASSEMDREKENGESQLAIEVLLPLWSKNRKLLPQRK